MNPAIMQVAGDLMVKAMDWEGAEEIAERLKLMLPPQILAAEKQGEDGGKDRRFRRKSRRRYSRGCNSLSSKKARIDELKTSGGQGRGQALETVRNRRARRD